MREPTLFSAVEPPTQRDGRTRFVRVVVERGIEGRGRVGEQGLTYEDPTGELEIGDAVEVPLGRGSVGGIVVQVGGAALLNGVPMGAVRAVKKRRGGRLTPALVELARWLAAYYVSPLGMVLATMTPAPVKQGVGVRTSAMLARAQTAPAIELKPRLRAAWDAVAALEASAFPINGRELAVKLGHRTRRLINELIGLGALREVRVERMPGARVHAGGFDSDAWRAPRPARLTPEQSAAVEGVGASMERFGVHLLRGVTGSGKTEVYLRLIERVVEQGREALVLVPEIALTPQTAGRFVSRFGAERVAVLHSKLSGTRRHEEWRRAAEGRASVIVGARSAVFAPLRRVGIIVVDEEHDTSYKQDQLPRFHARDVAIKRAQIEGCPVVLGSATPSMESWHNALPKARAGTGWYRLWELRSRAGGGVLPRVEIVDMARERRTLAQLGEHGQRVLGPRLRAAIDRTLADDGQVLLLLNRRGHTCHICCPDARCGFRVSCELCDVGLVYHKDRALPLGGVVRCHHCLTEQKLPRLCPTCGKALIGLGVGTQRAEEEIERVFAAHGLERGRALVRVDSDALRGGADLFAALAAFARGEVRVLLGTQMISKGLDVPNVRLVGVLDADTAGHIPDFRASERTFQLVSQVAGRAGRGTSPGLVIVQTWDPTGVAVSCAASHDYEAFATRELEDRARFGLPPMRRMARIVCRDPDREKARRSAEGIARELSDAARELAIPGVTITAAVPCPIARIAGKHRFSVDALAGTARDVQTLLGALRSRGLLTSDARTAVDVDPIALL